MTARCAPLPLLLLLAFGCGDDAAADGGADMAADLIEIDGATEAGAADAGPNAPYEVVFDTSAGTFVVTVDPALAPLGAARLRELVEVGYFDGSKFFRVVPNFVAQFGLAADPATTAMWVNRQLRDDPVVGSNLRGTMTFATAGPDTRTTQLFINLRDNPGLDRMGFAPLGEVTEGLDNVDAINDEYDSAPEQRRITNEGNAYLDAEFPRLTTITSARLR